jgi:hypothetical protein
MFISSTYVFLLGVLGLFLLGTTLCQRQRSPNPFREKKKFKGRISFLLLDLLSLTDLATLLLLIP